MYVAILVSCWLGMLNLSCRSTLRIEDAKRTERPLVVDEHVELARRYAPWIWHETHPTLGRQDVPARVDFDGDLRGDDNWDDFPFYALEPTVYYAVLETETHWFLTYHLFHPRDWAPVRLGLNDTHENDGENLQVVVSKESGLPVLLFTQAHFEGEAYARPDGGFADGDEELRGTFWTVGDDGCARDAGTHVAVFVESQGHGIYGMGPPRDGAAFAPDGCDATFACHGLVYRPARPGEAVHEPLAFDVAHEPIPYALESTVAKLWPGVRDGTLVGAGGLLDGTVRYEDERVSVDVPRYYEADRFSGPFGSDRGISPFAVDFGFDEGELGALFFDPARRYADVLAVPEPWSRSYVSYPFD